MKTMEKNAKRKLVDNYIHQYSPYKTQPLGVNVSAVFRIAKEKGCQVKELSIKDIQTSITH